jgi:hypothetical protein
MTPPDQTPSPESTSSSAPSPGTMHELLRRLALLEENNRKLRRQSMGTLIVTAILLGAAASLTYTAARHGLPGFVPDIVEAREFVLRDHEGRVRGAWGEDDQGSIRLVLQEAGSQASIKLNLLRDGSSGLTLADSAGNARMVIAVLPDQTTNLVFADGRGVARTVLGLTPRSGSSLVFADGGGTTRTAIGVDGRGAAMFSTGAVDTPDEEVVDSTEEDTSAKAPAKPARKRGN